MCSNKDCDQQQAFPSCPIIPQGNLSVYSVNRRSAFAMRCVGGDLSELSTFCGVMNLPKPVGKTSFSKINQTMKKAACQVQQQSMDDAAVSEFCLAEDIGDIRNIQISVDGTYMTRGHSSNVGVSTATGLKTGKVLDTGAKSKLCKSCEYWEKQDHTSEKYRKWAVRHAGKCTLTPASLEMGTQTASKRCLIQNPTATLMCRNWNESGMYRSAWASGCVT